MSRQEACQCLVDDCSSEADQAALRPRMALLSSSQSSAASRKGQRIRIPVIMSKKIGFAKAEVY